MRWHYRDAGLLWLFVPAYMVHMTEEWFTGFPASVARFAGRPLPDPAFLVINAVALALMIWAVRAATRSEDNGWMGIAIATIVLINTAFHSVGAIIMRSYAPGLVSAVVLYIPLGSLAMIRAFDHAPSAQVSRGIIMGVVVHAAVVVAAFVSTRM
jgi:hypothetical protein